MHAPDSLPRGLRFFKLCGSGNDFVGLDGRDASTPSRTAIAALCDRRFGIGADGVVRVAPGSAPGRVRLDYWNSDGSDAALCGNGSLCSAVLARRIGLVDSDDLVLETGAFPVAARVLGPDRAEIGVGAVDLPRERSDIECSAAEDRILFTVVGVPHLVVLVSDPSRVDLARRGRELRFHPALGAPGANVNFVATTPTTPTQSKGVAGSASTAFEIRTYERGVEGETLACGTGSTATGIALLSLGLAVGCAALRTASGEILSVRGHHDNDRYVDVTLAGEGRIVFAGALD